MGRQAEQGRRQAAPPAAKHGMSAHSALMSKTRPARLVKAITHVIAHSSLRNLYVWERRAGRAA